MQRHNNNNTNSIVAFNLRTSDEHLLTTSKYLVICKHKPGHNNDITLTENTITTTIITRTISTPTTTAATIASRNVN